METLTTKALAWHHIQSPTAEDLGWLKQKFNFHELLIGELTKPSARPKVEYYDHYLYMVLHFPIYDESVKKIYEREIDFLVTKETLITVTYDPIKPLDEFFKVCSSEKSCEDLYGSQTTAHLLFYVTKNLYNFMLRQLDHVHANVNTLEEKIFSGYQETIVSELAAARRDIIYFRRALKPHHVTLESLRQHGLILFGKRLGPYFTGLIGEYLKVWNLLENNKEALDGLYENSITLINIKQNEIMKLFTILAFMTFPLSLVISIIGIDSPHNPVLGSGHDFWSIVGFVLFSICLMLVVFRKKRWI